MTKELTFHERASRGFAWNYLYKLTEFGFMSLYTILVVRHFGPEISAPYAVFTALCTTVALLCAFAVDGVLLRYIQKIASNKNSQGGEISNIENFGLHHFFKTLFAFRLLVVTAVSLLIIAVLFLLPLIIHSLNDPFSSVRKFSPYIIIFLYAQAITAFCTFSLIGLLETKRAFYASLLSRGLLLGGGLILIIENSFTLLSAIDLFLLSTIINALYLLFAFNREVHNHTRENSKELNFTSVVREIWRLIRGRKHVKLLLATPLMLYGITTWGSDILSTVLGRQPDILMMRAILGEYSPQIGYYLSASIVLLVTEYIFLFGLSGTLVSIFSKLAYDDKVETNGVAYPRLAKARKEIAGFQNVVLLPLCAYMFVFAPMVMRSIYGEKYDAAIPMIRTGLGALMLGVGFFGGGMHITSLVAIGKERLVFRNRLLWGITNIAANFFLIRSYGGLGAIIGTQFANAFSCGTESYFAGKLIGGSFDLYGTLRIIIISAVAVTAGYYIIEWVGNEREYLLNTMISLVVVGIFTTAMYVFFKVPEAKKVWSRILLLFKQKKSAALVNE